MEGTKIFINVPCTVENKAECPLTTEAKGYMSSLKISAINMYLIHHTSRTSVVKSLNNETPRMLTR